VLFACESGPRFPSARRRDGAGTRPNGNLFLVQRPLAYLRGSLFLIRVDPLADRIIFCALEGLKESR